MPTSRLWLKEVVIQTVLSKVAQCNLTLPQLSQLGPRCHPLNIPYLPPRSMCQDTSSWELCQVNRKSQGCHVCSNTPTILMPGIFCQLNIIMEQSLDFRFISVNSSGVNYTSMWVNDYHKMHTRTQHWPFLNLPPLPSTSFICPKPAPLKAQFIYTSSRRSSVIRIALSESLPPARGCGKTWGWGWTQQFKIYDSWI